MIKSKYFVLPVIASLTLMGCNFIKKPSSESEPALTIDIHLSNNELSLREGTSFPLSFEWEASRKCQPTFTWKSSNSDVVTVDQKGFISALSVGQSTISVSASEDSSSLAQCVVTVPNETDLAIKKATPSYTYYDVNNTNNVMNHGEQKVLVIPTYFTDDSENATEENRLFIEKSFFGTNEECKWRSFTGYYQEASFNQLIYSGLVADTWYPSTYSKQEVLDTDYTSQIIAADALGWFKETYTDIDLSDYDSNNDGYIDSLYIIYASDYIVTEDNETTNLWGYRWSTSYQSNEGVGLQPHAFSWFSLKFLKNTSNYGGVPVGGSNTRIIIHEHGHMLGLPDYYDTSYTGNIDFVGSFDMQSNNVFDWNAFSKYSMGWITPYYVDEQTLKTKGSETITINASAFNGNCIIVKNDEWNGSPFDEYLMLELFNPYLGNNAYDFSHSTYRGMAAVGPGVKIYHVDARMYPSRNSGKANTFNGGGYYFHADNTYHASSQQNIVNGENIFKYQFLHLLQKEGINTFGKRNQERVTFTEGDLWQTGNTFSLGSHEGYKDYGPRFFEKDTTFNDGSSLNIGINFDYVCADYATITFTYVGN